MNDNYSNYYDLEKLDTIINAYNPITTPEEAWKRYTEKCKSVYKDLDDISIKSLVCAAKSSMSDKSMMDSMNSKAIYDISQLVLANLVEIMAIRGEPSARIMEIDKIGTIGALSTYAFKSGNVDLLDRINDNIDGLVDNELWLWVRQCQNTSFYNKVLALFDEHKLSGYYATNTSGGKSSLFVKVGPYATTNRLKTVFNVIASEF